LAPRPIRDIDQNPNQHVEKDTTRKDELVWQSLASKQQFQQMGSVSV